MELSKAATELVDEYRRSPGAEPLGFTRTAAYRQFIEAAEQAGFTGPEVEMDSEFSDRSPEWVAHASEEELRRYLHTLIRADRWNTDFPTAVLQACSGGQLGALAANLA
ncbi:hypothetical protein HPT29_009640 [Microvirga terrae]|uniref:Uncharacterized protein n=1 Tax=Microvirga terrae TaxID=2740529 RepID=A0ABY5RVU1_9HYPH|nr:hypothetical protein [Microvirga terrae]UVF21360.1 hypothetical protein HPT29_009640 [Microvirga terrae]